MSSSPRRTPLYERHVDLSARLVDFAGWEMPVYYVGINEEHRAVRARAGVFDTSHMGQLEISGSGSTNLLRRALANDVDRIDEGGAQYTFLLNEKGGIVDDLIVYRMEGTRWLLIVNASNVDVDHAHLSELAQRGTAVRDKSADYAMLALQGPLTFELLADIWPKKRKGALEGLKPFQWVEQTIEGVPCIVARTGYTGEPGVELLCPADRGIELWDAILACREHGVVPCGLGARDTLRLEMGFPLHGQDIDAKTTPIEAGLDRFVALGREFVGSSALDRQVTKGVKRRLVGLRVVDRAIPRTGYPILVDGERVGEVTSGTLSPSLDEGIGLGYVPPEASAPGTIVQVEIRGRARDAEITRPPFFRKQEN